MTYTSRWFGLTGHYDGKTTSETMMLLAGDGSRSAELHCSKDGKMSQDDPSARDVIALTKETQLKKVHDANVKNIASIEGQTCFSIKSPDSDEHRFCESGSGWFDAIEAIVRA